MDEIPEIPYKPHDLTGSSLINIGSLLKRNKGNSENTKKGSRGKIKSEVDLYLEEYESEHYAYDKVIRYWKVHTFNNYNSLFIDHILF